MNARTGLRRKIWIAFILQVAAISFATVLGVYGASAVLKHVLIQRALTEEAGHYWQRLAKDPGAALPDTYNMTGYRVPGGDESALPEALRGLGPGYHALPRSQGGSLVLVDDRPGGRLYLMFKQEQLDSLAFWFGVVPLILVLSVIYVIAFITYRQSKQAVSPVIWLANMVQRWDPKRPDIGALEPHNLPLDVEGESQVLAASLHDFATRIEAFVDRERNFTRDASHELRTPLTVIRIASDLLLADPSMPPHAQRSLKRIQTAGRDMEGLIEAFLILARASDVELHADDVDVEEIVRDQVEDARPLCGGRPVEVVVEREAGFALHAPARVVGVLLGNLIRNACIYTDRGRVEVRIGHNEVVVRDTGIGMNTEVLAHVFEPFYRGGQRRGGHGIGLSIVRRLADRFGWPVTLESTEGVGTTATVRFPQGRPLEE